MKMIGLFLLFFGIGSLPLYLFPSGVPQPSHFILLLSLFFLLFQSRFVIKFEFVLLAFWAFVFAREVVEFLLTGNAKSLLSPLFLSFNVLLFTGINSFYSNEKNIKLIIKTNKTIAGATIFAILVTIVGIFLLDSGETGLLEERKVGTFNNPNQLGYFSVCIASIVILLAKNRVLEIKYSLILIALAFVMSIFSQSKAATITIFIVMTGFGWLYSKTLNRKILFGFFTLLAIISVASYLISNSQVSDTVMVKRIVNLFNENDSNFEGRGYGLVKEIDGLNFLYGAGSEVENDSWTREIHSTFFSIFVYYGAIGISLFLIFYIKIFYALYSKFGLVDSIIIYSPPFLYGISHNGFRFTIFWIFLVLCLVLLDTTGSSQENKKNSTVHS